MPSISPTIATYSERVLLSGTVSGGADSTVLVTDIDIPPTFGRHDTYLSPG
jgi:hypothetical protein